MQTDNQAVVVEKLINAPVEKVWDALTVKEQMKQWYFDVSDFKPEVGFEFQFTGEGHKGEKYVHNCKVTDVVKYRKLCYTWKYEGLDGDSVVCFEFYPEDKNTKLRVVHSGLETFPQGNADFSKDSFNTGWNQIIGVMLEKFLITEN